jgi:hypothetical protein
VPSDIHERAATRTAADDRRIPPAPDLFAAVRAAQGAKP